MNLKEMAGGVNDKALKTHIAIVDDDVLVRESLCDCVESAGYSAEGFASAEEFLASSSGENAACWILDIACLILDIQLPGVSGLELQRRLARHSSSAGRVPYCTCDRRESRDGAKTGGEGLPVEASSLSRIAGCGKSGNPVLGLPTIVVRISREGVCKSC